MRHPSAGTAGGADQDPAGGARPRVGQHHRQLGLGELGAHPDRRQARAAGSYTEAVIIDASTGVPIKFVAGKGDVIVNYQVTRVTLADVAKGRF
jgi:hypothetical protein